MVSTRNDRWARRHAWIVGLIAVQALGIAYFAVAEQQVPAFAIGAVLTLVLPAIVTSVPSFGRTTIATVSSATLVAQTMLMVALFGSDLRPNVIMLADLCVIAMYELPVLFAAMFALVATATIGLSIADPEIFNLSGDPTDTWSALVCAIAATGVGAIAMGSLWSGHQRLLHSSEQQARLIEAYLAVSGSLLIVIDRDGMVLEANRMACFTIDREHEEVVGKDWFSLALPEAVRELGRPAFEAAFDEGLAEVGAGGEFSYENVLVSATGEERNVTWWATVLQDEQGRPVSMVCSGTDVTEQRRARAEVERGRVELDALRRLAQKVASLDDARQAVVDAAIALTGATMVGISEPDRTRETLTYTTATDPTLVGFSIHLGREASMVGTAFLGGQPQFMGDLSTHKGVHPQLSALASDGKGGSALHQPIMGANGTLGCISVAWAETLDSVSDRRAELIGLIATEAAIALRRRDSLAQLERAALVDPLTGVANRRAFDAELPLALRRAAEGKYPLSLVVMDLNEFKAVNDVLGHEAGDEVLIKAAGAWAEALRAGDLLSRIGGDEFTVLLPTCDESEMTHIIARLRAVTPHGPGTSLGGAVWDGSETAASLIRRADSSQYEDKARGKAERGTAPQGAAPRGAKRRRPRVQDPRADAPPTSAAPAEESDI